MADYFTHFSCVLDVGSPEKAIAALDLLTDQSQLAAEIFDVRADDDLRH